jgi:hypothetical protein
MHCTRISSQSWARAGMGRLRERRRGRVSGRCSLVLLSASFLVVPQTSAAARHRIGPGREFTTLEAAVNGHTWAAGDTLQLDAGTFAVTQMLKPLGSGTAGRPIVVRGAGIGATVISGEALSNSKALWDVEQNNQQWIFEDFTLAHMRGAQTNARGFFLVNCTDVVVQRCEVTDCWNGFMSTPAATRVTVQYCDVHHNGGLQGPAHNMYMSGGTDFLIQHNWIHDAQYGTCYKDRTHNLRLCYNLIENAAIEGYEISLAGDGSAEQGDALLLGNVIVKCPTSANQTHLVRFEDGRAGTLTLIHNTVIGQSRNVLVSSIARLTTLHNNILYSGGTIFSGPAATGTNNWLGAGRSVAGLTGSLSSTSPLFQNPGAGDYRLAPGSPCIDAANPAVFPQPTSQWVALPGSARRTVTGSAPDVGAYEATAGPTAVQHVTWSALKARYR